MDAGRDHERGTMKRTTVERISDRELVVTRTIDAPARLVFEAWTRPELFKRWWAPKSLGMKAVWAKRASRFQPSPTDAKPDHVVEDFVELRGILRERYGLRV